jgi:hypothetical protein
MKMHCNALKSYEMVCYNLYLDGIASLHFFPMLHFHLEKYVLSFLGQLVRGMDGSGSTTKRGKSERVLSVRQTGEETDGRKTELRQIQVRDRS